MTETDLDSWISSQDDDIFDRELEKSSSPTPFDDTEYVFKPAKPVETERYERLKSLIERSKTYSSILAEKLAESSQNNTSIDQTQSESKKRRYDRSSTDGRKKHKNKHKHKHEKFESTTSTETQTIFKQPSLITGATLHSYQLEGVAWLASLYENGLNGILADDMGLGKTIQTIAFISHLVENRVGGLFLIVSPLATLNHWCSEFKRFAPSIPCATYYGTKEERAAVKKKFMSKSSKVVSAAIITTYDLILMDYQSLMRYKWKYLVIDEGHRIKNMNSKLLKKLKKLNTSSRLLLSGTPLQNNISELWTMLNFLLPEIFSDLDVFEAWFRDELSDNSADSAPQKNKLVYFEPEIVTKIHDILRPFLLRRLKASVLTHLPPKREYTIYAPLSDIQLQLYEQIVNDNIRQFLEEELLKAHDPTGEKQFRERDEESRQRFSSVDVEPVSDYDDDQILSLRRPRRERFMNLSYEEPSLETLITKIDSKKANEKVKKIRSKSLFQESIDADYKHYEVEKKRLSAQKLLSWVSLLRCSCNSPLLLDYPYNLPADEELGLILPLSGKMKLLDTLCRPLVERGHRILIFSQFLGMLDILEDWAEQLRGWRTCRIDGRLSYEDRQQQIDMFNNDQDIKLFLLSTRSGGLGLNLTSADTVILFDSDWNPQIDLQAMDRVHRIGQKKPVMVYRLATLNTIEQRLLELAGNKRKLEQLVIEDGHFTGFTPLQFSDSWDIEDKRSILKSLEHCLKVNEPGQLEALLECQNKDYTLTPALLETLLDRSPEAYARKDYNLPSFITRTATRLHN